MVGGVYSEKISSVTLAFVEDIYVKLNCIFTKADLSKAPIMEVKDPQDSTKVTRPLCPMDLRRAEAIDNPYPDYQQLIASYPVVWDEEINAWLVSSYDLVHEVMTHDSISSDRITPLLKRLPPALLEAGGRTAVDVFARTILMMDPPKHTVIRRALQPAFTMKAINAQQPAIRRIANRVVDACIEKKDIDVVQDLAYPLPTLVIADWLGADPADGDAFKGWSDDIVDFIATYVKKDPSRVILDAVRSINAMKKNLQAVLERCRMQGGDNLMCRLLDLQKEHPALTDEDLLANAILLVVAGHETTIHLITNSIFVFQQFDEIYQQLRHNPDPKLLDRFIEEVLRFESPVQRLARMATADFQLGEQQIKEGDRIICIMGAANRDPDVFIEPDQFRLDREKNRHLAFGDGQHHCIGAQLARLEAREVLSVFLASCNVESWQKSRPVRSHNLSLRAIESLKIRVAGVQ